MKPGYKIFIAVLFGGAAMSEGMATSGYLSPFGAAIAHSLGLGLLAMGSWLAPSPLLAGNQERRKSDKHNEKDAA